MLRAIIYNKIEGNDEVLGVVQYKDNKVTFSRDMPDDLQGYLRTGITGKEGYRIFPSVGAEFVESLPEFLRGSNLYAILKD